MEEFECANCGHKVMQMFNIPVHFDRTLLQILTLSNNCRCGCNKPEAATIGEEVK